MPIIVMFVSSLRTEHVGWHHCVVDDGVKSKRQAKQRRQPQNKRQRRKQQQQQQCVEDMDVSDEVRMT